MRHEFYAGCSSLFHPLRSSFLAAFLAFSVLGVASVYAANLEQPVYDRFESQPRKFGNLSYQFELAPKGFVSRLAKADDQVLIDAAGAIALQGGVLEGAAVAPYHAGGIGNFSYQAEIEKYATIDAVVFEVAVTHPRFTLKQTFTCLPDRVQVAGVFTPIQLNDERGPLAAAYNIQILPSALTGPMTGRPGAITYSTKQGPMVFKFPTNAWQIAKNPGAGRVIPTETAINFYFTGTSEAPVSFEYEIRLP